MHCPEMGPYLTHQSQILLCAVLDLLIISYVSFLQFQEPQNHWERHINKFRSQTDRYLTYHLHVSVTQLLLLARKHISILENKRCSATLSLMQVWGKVSKIISPIETIITKIQCLQFSTFIISTHCLLFYKVSGQEKKKKHRRIHRDYTVASAISEDK